MSFLKGSFVLILGFCFKLILALLTDRFIATSVLIENYGIYRYSITFVTLISSLSGLGFDSSIVREISISDNFNYIRKTIFTSFILILFVTVVMYFLINTNYVYVFINLNREVFTLISFSLFAISINQFIVGLYSGLKEVEAKVYINDIMQPLLFLSLLCMFAKYAQIEIISVLFLISINTSLALNIIFVSRKLRVKFGNFKIRDLFDNISLRSYYTYSFPILVTSVFIGLATNIDKIVLVKIVGVRQIGLYFAAFTLSNVLSFILSTLLFLFLPIASSFYGKKKFFGGSYISAYISKWLMLISFVPFWLLFNYSSNVLTSFYGSGYVGASSTLKILAVAGFVNVSVGFTGQSLLALGDSFSQMLIRFVGVVLTLAIACVLGVNYGIDGIATSVLISLMVTNILQISTIYYKFRINLVQLVNIKTYIYIIFIITILTIRKTIFDIDRFTVSYIVDILLYFLAIYLLKIINSKDKRVVRLIN